MTHPSIHRQIEDPTGAPAWYRPVIGIPALLAGTYAQASAPVWHAYVQAIEQAGGIPLWLPVAEAETFSPLWMWLDGVLLPGGMDIQPATYGETPHPLLGQVDSNADQFEFWLAREALERDLPLLGINRGLQVLNVICAGSLFQELGAQLGTAWSHGMRNELPARR